MWSVKTMTDRKYDRKPIHDNVEDEEKISGLLLRRVRLTKEEFGDQAGNQCWGVPNGDGSKLIWAQVLVLEVEDETDELCSVAFLYNRGVDATVFSATLDPEAWTDGFLVPEGMEAEANAVDMASWNISGWQDDTHKNAGISVQKPLEPGLDGDAAWSRVCDAARNGLIRRAR